jgi:hypothetical protein
LEVCAHLGVLSISSVPMATCIDDGHSHPRDLPGSLAL